MLIAHSALYVLARGVPGAVNLLAIVVFTRMLAPEAYGQYALVVSAVALLNVILFQWLRLSLGRFFPAEIADPRPLLATLLALFSVIALFVAMGGALALTVIENPAWRNVIVIAVPLVWAQAWFELNLAMAVTKLDPARYGWMSGAKAGLALVTGVLFVMWGFGAQGPLVGLLIALLVVGIAGARGWWSGLRLHWDRARIAQIARYGLPLATTLVLGYVVSTSDRFMLAAFLNTGVAGLYAAAYDLGSQALTVLLMIVNLAGNPLLIRALEFHGIEAAKQQAARLAVLLLAVALPTASGIALLAPDVAVVTMGHGFREATATILPIIVLAALLAGMRAYYFDLAFQLGHWTKGQAWIVGIAAVANLALNWWWIPKLGISGAAWATVAAYGIALVLSILLGRRAFPLPIPWKAVIRISLAATIMLAVMSLVPGEPGMPRFVLRVLLGATALAGASFMLGVIGMLKSPAESHTR